MKRVAEEEPTEGTEGDRKQHCARYEQCEDAAHSGGNAEELRRCRKDGKVRCKWCRQGQKRREDAVGTRGLDLAAHFRSKQLQQRRLPAVEVIASSPEDDVKEAVSAAEKVPTAQPVALGIDVAAPLRIEEESTDVPNTSPSSPSDVKAKPKKSKKGALGVKCLHIGCDVCPRWFVVDQVLFDYWCNCKFTCCMVGETCSRKETHTALVACKGVPHMLSRYGLPVREKNSRPQLLPGGCWDIWRPGTALSSAQPRIFAAPISAVSLRWREEAAKLFDKGWTQEASQRTIRHLLQCDQDPFLRDRDRRSKRPSLILWLLWQESPCKKGEVGTILSVAILSRQCFTTTGPLELQGGMVLEYISVEPGTGAKAYWLVLAAEEVALLMGHTELFSACDLNQGGQSFDGRAKPALAAHRRWGFEDTDQKEWTDRRFEVYSEGCNVRYMVKIIGH